MSSWTRTSALPTIGSVMQRSHQVVLGLAAVLSMIRLKFSVKCSAVADLAAAFSRRSLAGAVAQARKIGAADQICVTTCKSDSRRQLLARKNRSRSRNWILARNAGAAAPHPARAGSVVRPAAAVVRSSVRVDFFQISQTCPRCHGAGEIIEKPCEKCRGEGRVEKLSRVKLKIPAGIREGTRLRSLGNGEAGIGGAPPGDLYVVIHIKEHQIFQREGDDLYCEVPIPFSVAALGGEIDVPTLEGKAHLKVTAGTQSGQMFKLRGKGIVNVNGRGHGDLFARLIVEVPSRLNGEQRRKLEEFAALCGEENTPIRKG